jgi:hypothetical protein
MKTILFSLSMMSFIALSVTVDMAQACGDNRGACLFAGFFIPATIVFFVKFAAMLTIPVRKFALGFGITAALCFTYGETFGQQSEFVIHFSQGGSKLTNFRGTALDSALQGYRIDSIVGYASIEGSTSSNLTLSHRRAANIATTLGTDAPVSYHGETTQFGDNLEDNRVAVIYATWIEELQNKVDTITAPVIILSINGTILDSAQDVGQDSFCQAWKDIWENQDSIFEVQEDSFVVKIDSFLHDSTAIDTFATDTAVTYLGTMTVAIGGYCVPAQGDTLFQKDAIWHYMQAGFSGREASRIVAAEMRKGKYEKSTGQWTLVLPNKAKKAKTKKSHTSRVKARKTCGKSVGRGFLAKLLNALFPNRNC